MSKQEEHLWDPASASDAEVAALQERLAGARWRGELPGSDMLPARRGSRPRHLVLGGIALLVATAAAVAVMFNGALFEQAPGSRGPGYRLERLHGALQVDGRETAASADVRPGGRIRTGREGGAVLHIDGLGSLRLESGTELTILDPERERASTRWESSAECLLSLEVGAFQASIFAPAGAFQVQTPAGLSVDLGCVYRAEVAADGATQLAVLSGRVAFEGDGRRVTVPAGAAIQARPGERPSTPLYDDAAEEFARLVTLLDRGVSLTEQEVTSLLAVARARDALSLVHLLGTASVGSRLFEHLAAADGPPAGVTRAGCLGGDADMIAAWVDRL